MDFEALVNEHKDAVYRQMVRTCENREDAEDVLIEALMRAYQQLDQLQEDFILPFLDIEHTRVLAVDLDHLELPAREPIVENSPLELLVPAPQRFN